MAAFSGKPYPCGPVFRYSTDAPVRLSSMSDGENKNWPNDDESSADFVYLHSERGSSSVGRASASQAEGREFESRLPLDENGLLNIQETVFCFCYFFILTS